MGGHTPGPWVVVDRAVRQEDKSVYPKHIVGGVTKLEVCLLETPAVANAVVNDPTWKHLADSKMAHANARLIAAAPELLEALRELYAQVRGEASWLLDDTRGGSDRLAMQCEDAIAKATGAPTDAAARAELVEETLMRR